MPILQGREHGSSDEYSLPCLNHITYIGWSQVYRMADPLLRMHDEVPVEALACSTRRHVFISIPSPISNHCITQCSIATRVLSLDRHFVLGEEIGTVI